jgi:hypothetical protein
MNFCIFPHRHSERSEESHTFLKKGTPKTFIEFLYNRIPRGVVFVSSDTSGVILERSEGSGRNPACYRIQSRLWRVWNPQLVAVWNRHKVPYGIHAKHCMESTQSVVSKPCISRHSEPPRRIYKENLICITSIF